VDRYRLSITLGALGAFARKKFSRKAPRRKDARNLTTLSISDLAGAMHKALKLYFFAKNEKPKTKNGTT
jgi:hypothetical protein